MAKEAEVAAKWWADKLRSQQLPGREYTRPGETSGLEQMMALMTAKQPEFTPEQVDAFQQYLLVSLETHINAILLRQPTFYISLGVDYHPDELLERSGRLAGIPTLDGFLSWKTRMWISNGSVKVREGYGARAGYLLGFEAAMQEWETRRQLWIDDVNSERTEVLRDYPEYADLSPEESFAQLVRPPFRFED